MGKKLLFLSGILLLAFCSPPEHYQRRKIVGPSKSHLRDKTSDSIREDLFSLTSEVIRVKLHEGIALPIESTYYRFHSKGGVESGSGSFIPTTEGLLTVSGNVFGFQGKYYPGEVQILRYGNRFLYINLLPLEEYLVSVSGHEMSPSWPLEALKAQAVVSRTYLFQKIKEAKGRLWHVDATTNHQVYGGIVKNDFQVRQAVSSTQGQVVQFAGELAQVFFHSCCGGRTASATEVWGGTLTYLPVQKSRYCELAPVYRWKETILLSEISRRFGLGKIKALKVKERTVSNRVKSLQAITNQRVVTILADEFRKKLGASRIKSTFFALKQQGSSVLLLGRGYGHGVGLCQWGAKFMAEKYHFSYWQILQHYFPGTSLSNLSLMALKVS